MRLLPLVALIGLTACTAPSNVEVTKRGPAPENSGTALPSMLGFAPTGALPVARSNMEIAEDMLDLQFRMESGRALPVLTRFEGPITVATAGQVPASAVPDLARLIGRFRNEAGLNIGMAPAGAAPSILIEFQPRATLQRAVPNAACFVVPNARSFDEYRANRASADYDWARLRSRERVAVFIPSDTSPQEVRDCLHEELAQAMGPLNDLYRLPDSVFNDDNFQSVLTGFDMLALRVHYAPELANGMNEAQVAARLPALLARLNPAGEGRAGKMPELSSRAWINAVEAAFSPRAGHAARLAAADRMISIAMAQGWNDIRLGFGHFAKGRILVARDPQSAIQSFATAGRIYRGIPGAEIHAAHTDMQLAAIALATGNNAMAVTLADRAIPAVRQAQNAALLATLMLIKAEGLENLGRAAEAKSLRLDSMGWARYGFGAERQMRARIAEIAALGARGARGQGA